MFGDALEYIIIGNYVYGVNISGMGITDITNPANPVVLGSYSTGGNAYGMDVSGSYAYLAVGMSFKIVDISNPSHIVLVSSCNPSGYTMEVAVSGNYAYLVGGFVVMDISNPAHPVEVGYSGSLAAGFDVHVSGDYAYAVGEYDGLSVIDISNPLNPLEVGYYNTYGNARNVTESDGYIYVSDGNSMGIYQYTPSQVSISLTPAIPNIQIPANGGNFDFNIEVTNNGNTTQILDIWTMATLPNGSEFGPIINISDFAVDPGITVNRDRTQQVPASAPQGYYLYHGYVGSYPDPIVGADCFFFIKASAADGSYMVDGWNCEGEGFGGQTAAIAEIPKGCVLLSAYPNPFNQQTTISFDLLVAGDISLKVYDIQGRQVGAIHESPLQTWYPAGQHSVVWDAEGMSSGIYFVRLEAGDFMQTRKMLLVK